MNIHAVPDTTEKLARLGNATRFEPVGDRPDTEKQRLPNVRLMDCVSEVSTPGGPKPILKTMVTTACEKNCFYCPFRAGRSKTERITFQPDELAGTFDKMQRAGVVDGIFLSSGIIKGGVTTQDKIIDTIDIIRNRYQYRGYVHLKIMPGSEYDQVYRAMQLADRVSINLEGATPERLEALAPKKDYNGDLLQRLYWTEQIRQRELAATGRRLARISTQFVVGAVGDTDLELLSVSAKLYNQIGLQRAYYSAFEPIIDTPFEHLASTSQLRERRLYQSSFLLRDYQWEVEDLPFIGAGNLALDLDPKRAWADANLRHAPIDVMTATQQQLMRIPGIGPESARKIVQARRSSKLTDIHQLRAIGVRSPEQAAPYILIGGRKPSHQLPLFGE
jgi:predicted DNA-binding helix-hairpin-helix protein